MYTSHGKDKAKMFDRERMLMCVEWLAQHNTPS